MSGGVARKRLGPPEGDALMLNLNGVEPMTPLDKLASAIQDAHAEATSSMREALDAACRAGELLAEAKQSVGHGGWRAWLDDKFDFSQQTAALYMRLANNREQIETAVSISDARRLLAAPRAATSEWTETAVAEWEEEEAVEKGRELGLEEHEDDGGWGPPDVAEFVCSRVYQATTLSRLIGGARVEFDRMVEGGEIPPRDCTLGGRMYGWTGGLLNKWMRETGRALVEDGEGYRIRSAEDVEETEDEIEAVDAEAVAAVAAEPEVVGEIVDEPGDEPLWWTANKNAEQLHLLLAHCALYLDEYGVDLDRALAGMTPAQAHELLHGSVDPETGESWEDDPGLEATLDDLTTVVERLRSIAASTPEPEPAASSRDDAQPPARQPDEPMVDYERRLQAWQAPA